MNKVWLLSIFFFALPALAGANDFDHKHAAWDSLLQEHVYLINDGTASQVDYAGFKSDQSKLNNYLNTLSAVTTDQFNLWTKDEQLAFLINAYNAFTVKLILDNYPDISSIKDLGSLFTSPWKIEFFNLLGDKRHLDWIEQDMIRDSGHYNEPLIHFAVNCASIGCPALLNEAFSGDQLERQLLDVTRRFLQDRSRNYFDNSDNTLYISSILDWYEEDFQKGWRSYSSLKDFFSKHADWLGTDESDREKLSQRDYAIKFLEYDWRLNRKTK